MKKGLAIWGIKKREGWQLKVKKRNEREGSEGFLVLFSCFSFLSKGVSRENIITGEGDFPFFKGGESIERVELSLKACFHH